MCKVLMNAKKRHSESWISFNNRLAISSYSLVHKWIKSLYMHYCIADDETWYWPICVLHSGWIWLWLCITHRTAFFHVVHWLFMCVGSSERSEIYMCIMLSVTCGQYPKHSDLDQTSQVYVPPGKLYRSLSLLPLRNHFLELKWFMYLGDEHLYQRWLQ